MKHELETIINIMKSNKDIPRQFTEYTRNMALKGYEGMYLNILFRSPEQTISKIGGYFYSAANIIGSTTEELLKSSSFQKNDYDDSKVFSLFAELRAIIYLSKEGFNNIKILRQSRKKRADFCASMNGLQYVIEVTNSGYMAKENRWRHNNIVDFLINKLKSEQKYNQLQETLNDEKCDKMILILVIDTIDKVALNEHNSYLKILKDAWLRFGKIQNLHLCIVTGMSEMKSGPDDTVFPEWETMN